MMRKWWFCLVACFALVFCSFRASAQTASNYDALVHQGNAQLQSGNNDLALTKAKSATKINAHRWEAYALAGGALINLKRYEEATDNFSEAIKYAPDGKQDGLRNLRKQCLAAELGVAAPASSPQTAPQPAAATTQAEVVLWKTIENSNNLEDFQTYLSQYPNGAFAALAHRHLDDLQQFTEQQRQLQQEQAKELDLDKTIWITYPQLKGTPQDGRGSIWVFDNGTVYRRELEVHVDAKHPKHNKDDFATRLADAKAVVSGQLDMARFVSGLMQTGTYTTAAPANVTVTDKRDLDGCRGPGVIWAFTIDHGEMTGTLGRKGPA